MIPVTPFKVIVTSPVSEEDGALKKGAHLTVRAIIPEHRLDGAYILFFLVWNEKRKRFMLEPAAQFTPIEK